MVCGRERIGTCVCMSVLVSACQKGMTRRQREGLG
jgi:hypothetical protein